MKKNDFILIIFVVVIGIIGLVFFQLNSKKGGEAVVYVDGKEHARLMLKKESRILIHGIGGTNELVIQDGFADITDADCPDKVCVKQKKISKKGETLVCLPHKVVVEIEGNEQSTLDGIAS